MVKEPLNSILNKGLNYVEGVTGNWSQALNEHRNPTNNHHNNMINTGVDIGTQMLLGNAAGKAIGAAKGAGKAGKVAGKLDDLGGLADDVTGAGNLKLQNYMDDLANSGVKYTPENVISVTKTPEGKLVWLEKGNASAGLEHVLKHSDEFVTKGIKVEQIPEFLTTAVAKGKIIGMQGTKPIYEVVFDGKVQRAAIGVSNNGFIVGANPVSLP